MIYTDLHKDEHTDEMLSYGTVVTSNKSIQIGPTWKGFRKPVVMSAHSVQKSEDVTSSIIGDFGRWQLKISILMALLKLPIAWYQLNIIFMAPPQDFWCSKPSPFSKYSDEEWRKLSSPHVEEHPCLIFDPDLLAIDPFMDKTLIPLVPCKKFVYDTSVFKRTITSDWNLVCSKHWLTHVVSGKWRTIIPVVYQLPFGIGNAIMAGLAYWLRDWRKLESALGACSSLFILYWFWIPESPRWLLATGQTERAAGSIGGNIFIAVSVTGIISTFGGLTCIFIVTRVGRKTTVGIYQIVTASCFVFILLMPRGSYANDWPRLLFAGIGFAGMAGTIPALYLFSGELFPTLGRNVGVSGVTTFARIASMVAPAVVTLDSLFVDLPLIILTIISFGQILIILPLPETKDTPLPDTLEQAEQF
ncbi:hypothetical protein HF086_016859 [Spodoptera exigua]|uniref:Major facilitator superfamily (MFS) profile domain-containing protein n=1 Tax=Spodoptera exigua TaxID=7107 RepID=A0A922M0Q4_SPOEX|nr:hypothetical protein HF086_016859 [Spodoptera exigua]